MLQLSEFVWALRSSVWIVFNIFLLIDPTDRSKISSDRKRLFFALRIHPHSFFANTPFKKGTKYCVQTKLDKTRKYFVQREVNRSTVYSLHTVH